MLHRFLAALVVGLAASMAFAPAAVAECMDWPPRANERLDVAYAFMATVVEASNTIDPDNPDSADFNWHVELRVDRLYRGRLPKRISYSGWAVGCHELRGDRLSTGDRVFIVSNVFRDEPRPPGADPFAGIDAGVIAWKRVEGRWRFYEEALDSGSDGQFYSAAARRATTTAEILRLVSVAFLPDTASELIPQRDSTPWRTPVLALAFLLGLVVVRRRLMA
jgi:hypothetical protein